MTQGENQTPRRHELHFGEDAPSLSGSRIPVWVRDGWNTLESSVREEAMRVGSDSPLLFLFIPKQHADELTTAIAERNAARATLQTRPDQPITPEGMQAQSAMQTRSSIAERQLNSLIDSLLADGRVFKGGGGEVTADTLAGAVEAGVSAAVVRLFPSFDTTNVKGWDRVVKQVQKWV